LIRQRLTGRERLIVIDKIQKLPLLLNEAQVTPRSEERSAPSETGSSGRW
jgi:hypothetical protein